MFYFLDADNSFLFYPRYPQPLREDRMNYSMADRLRARCRQLGLNTVKVGELAGVNRTFVYDIMRGRSESPNLEKLQRIADVLKVERNWLLHGLGEVEGESPIIENPDLAFVAVPYVNVRASMGGGQSIDAEPDYGRPYHFQKSWIKNDLKSDPANLRIMHVVGDSMMPTLQDRDIVLVDTSRRSPTPPGIFVLHDGMGLVAKRLEHIPNSDPPRVRIISDNPHYSPYEGVADEINIIGRIRWFARDM
jgi:phage repressor protein C with HTH and peptisase S24 domain